jgi:hypothetical protein
MDTLWKTNVTGLSVQAFVCMQTRREAKPEEVRKGSGVVANFLCNYAVIMRRSGRVLVPFCTSVSSVQVTSRVPTCT